MREAILKGDNADIAYSYHSLGIYYSQVGNQSLALEFFEKSLEMRKRIYKSNHAYLAISYNSLATSYGIFGDY